MGDGALQAPLGEPSEEPLDPIDLAEVGVKSARTFAKSRVDDWIGPKAEWQLSDDRNRKRTSRSTIQTANFDPGEPLGAQATHPNGD